MKHSQRMKKLLFVLLMAMLFVFVLQTAQAGKCPRPDGTYGDHSWRPWEIDIEATCSRSGKQLRDCTICGQLETARIPRTPHSYGKWYGIKAATCTAEGERGRKCKVCEYEQIAVTQKKNHSWGEWTIETGDHSCQFRICALCGER